MSYTLHFNESENYWVGRFRAMASNCELLLDMENKQEAEKQLNLVMQEVHRIEQKFSRFRDDNIVYSINHAEGASLEVDQETASLLDFAQQCYLISEGLFDITSGVLQQVWRFDGSDNIPNQTAIDAILNKVGWNKVKWNKPRLQMPNGVMIDFGGIGKEYAVDRCQIMLSGNSSALINLGGDISVTGPRVSGNPWIVGVEDPNDTSRVKRSAQEYALYRGGLATSGDVNRYIFHNGKRYGHILNPKTGWPAESAPRSVTVAAATCTDAGLLSTLAILQGKQAEIFLKQQEVEYWIVW